MALLTKQLIINPTEYMSRSNNNINKMYNNAANNNQYANKNIINNQSRANLNNNNNNNQNNNYLNANYAPNTNQIYNKSGNPTNTTNINNYNEPSQNREPKVEYKFTKISQDRVENQDFVVTHL
jgi:hypothetical protein